MLITTVSKWVWNCNKAYNNQIDVDFSSNIVDTFIFSNFGPRPAAAVTGVGAVGVRGRHLDQDPQPHPAGDTWLVTLSTWLVTRDTCPQDGRCYGEDRSPCSPDTCRAGGECCRDNSVCNLDTRGPGPRGWLTCTCLGRCITLYCMYNCIIDHCRR